MDPNVTASADDLLPAELARHTVESLYAQHGLERNWIYWLILAGVGGALASLPMIKVDVAVRAPGVVKALTDRVDLKTTVSGRISEVLVSDNVSVVKGQALLVVAAEDIEEQQHRQAVLLREKSALIDDLQTLLTDETAEVGLNTAALRHEAVQYRAQLDTYRLAEAKAGNELTRYTALADKGIATRQELDNARYEVERLQAESRLLREQIRARWAARMNEEKIALEDIISTMRRLTLEKEHYVLRAPVNGVLVGFNGWSEGGRILAGQSVGGVSPADALCVESQVSSRDIGMVRTGQRVRLQVDAYPYTQWGMLDGTVVSLGADLIAGSAGVPGYFKVLIRPLADHLVLSNGLRGELRKGLTLTVRYVVAQRSLLQILYDDASAWLSPQSTLNPISSGHP